MGRSTATSTKGRAASSSYNTLDPDGPVSETLLVTLGESVQSADGVLTNHFGPDTPLGANRGIERARVTLVDGTQGAAELYTDTRVAEITVTANDATRPAGSPNPDFTATIDPDGTFQPDGTARRDWRVDRGNLTFDTEADLLFAGRRLLDHAGRPDAVGAVPDDLCRRRADGHRCAAAAAARTAAGAAAAAGAVPGRRPRRQPVPVRQT